MLKLFSRTKPLIKSEHLAAQDFDERIVLAEKMGLDIQVRLIKAERAGFYPKPFNDICAEMGWCRLVRDRLHPSQFWCGRLAIMLGGVDEYNRPLRKSILDSIQQNKEIFDCLRIIGPVSHFNSEIYNMTKEIPKERKDPYLIGVIANPNSHLNPILFPIIRWE